MTKQEFLDKGWCRFSHDPALQEWIDKSLHAARETVHAPENAEWHRCQGTWFVGVNALPNDVSGAVAGGSPVSGKAVDFIHSNLGLTGFEWDRAQISICYPGYPKPMEGESDANFAFRRDRDAAHVDGLRHEGPERRRFLDERHGFVLGIPLVEASEDASPLVIWEGSHHIVRETLSEVFSGIEPQAWSTVDVTEAYHVARRTIFDTCKRVPVPAKPGESYVLHRLSLHGIAPWADNATAGPDGRMIAYFRPVAGKGSDWLLAP